MNDLYASRAILASRQLRMCQYGDGSGSHRSDGMGARGHREVIETARE